MCSTIAMGTGKSAGSRGMRARSACGPPVEIPRTTTSVRRGAPAGRETTGAGSRASGGAGARPTVAREAAAEGKPFMHHLAHLAVHGFLHLVGYDHEANEDADAMEGLEIAILARLEVPDPYLLRDQA